MLYTNTKHKPIDKCTQKTCLLKLEILLRKEEVALKCFKKVNLTKDQYSPFQHQLYASLLLFCCLSFSVNSSCLPISFHFFYREETTYVGKTPVYIFHCLSSSCSVFCLQGHGVEKNETEAIELFKLSAEKVGLVFLQTRSNYQSSLIIQRSVRNQ